MNNTPDEFAMHIAQGNTRVLSRAITLLESQHTAHQRFALDILSLAAKTATHNTKRIGVSGSPGSGKSSFIEALGTYILSQGMRVAVLAIDPSSRRTGGSILGDRARMEVLSNHPNAFVRATPSWGELGGVSHATYNTMLLCEAAGYDTVIVETVGVGQSEIDVAEMTDVFLHLFLPGSGDELQGIKRGIMESTDIFVITKADGYREDSAKEAAAKMKSILPYFTPKISGWSVPIIPSSAETLLGISEVWQSIDVFFDALHKNNALESLRNTQKLQQTKKMLHTMINRKLYTQEHIKKLFEHHIQRVLLHETSLEEACDAMLAAIKLS